MELDEAAQRLVTAFLVEFADRDDDDLIPLRRFLIDVGEACGVPADGWEENVEEWTTVGELRARTRAALAGLARGEGP